ncbi:hypothetical protein SAMD00024442_49_4 [Candidatus Symbiothrix dinenymphae]|nr:hypothetical protein SAMD00024442_49_4 [Candidatus Symbiothrix dinenymphae]
MKRFIVLTAIAVAGLTMFSTAAVAQTADDAQKVVSVDRLVHDFGIVPEAGEIKTTFVVTNNTDGPVLVTNVRTTCGCTVPSWTKTPIEAGQKGEIAVVYNTAGRPGSFSKEVTISTSGEPQTLQVKIKGTVQ